MGRRVKHVACIREETVVNILFEYLEERDQLGDEK
jgi:hypothetical protein